MLESLYRFVGNSVTNVRNKTRKKKKVFQCSLLRLSDWFCSI